MFKLKRVTVPLPSDFEPKVTFGSNVNAGDVLGYGTVYEVLEKYPLKKGCRVAVDDGVFVQQGDLLFSCKRGLDTVETLADHDGVIKIAPGSLQVVDVKPNQPITSPVAGRVVLLSKGEIIIETKFVKVPFFVSDGSYVKGKAAYLLHTGKIVTRKEALNVVSADVIVLGGALTFRVFRILLKMGFRAFIAPYIDWNDYAKIFKSLKGISLGVLQGMGVGTLWDVYKHIFSNISSSYIEADFGAGEIYVPAYDIMTLPTRMLIFKDSTVWGAQVREVAPLEGQLYVAQTLGEKIVANVDEIFKT